MCSVRTFEQAAMISRSYPAMTVEEGKSYGDMTFQDDIITEEDKELFWDPALVERVYCGYCGSTKIMPKYSPSIFVKESSRMLEGHYLYHLCENCGAKTPSDALKHRVIKSYKPYDVLMHSRRQQREMLGWEYDWFEEHGSNDIRDYPYKRAPKGSNLYRVPKEG